jgi:hypothetical protein
MVRDRPVHSSVSVAGSRSTPWDSQPITNSLEARQPQHLLKPPVPIVATIRWAVDGEEQLETVALGWSGQHVYVRIADARFQNRAIWPDAADVKRR